MLEDGSDGGDFAAQGDALSEDQSDAVSEPAEALGCEPDAQGPRYDDADEAEQVAQAGFATVWDGVELVLRQMVGALDALRGDLQGLGQRIDTRPVEPARGADKALGELGATLKSHNREMIDRLELHIVKLFGRVNADALDLRGQMNRIERSLAQIASAQKPSFESHAAQAMPAWAEQLMTKMTEMEANIRRFDGEQIDDLKLRVEMMDRKLGDIIHGRPALPAEGAMASTSQELRLLLAEVIALQQRGDAANGRMAG